MHPRQLDFIKLQARLSKGVAIGSWGARNPSFVSLFFCHANHMSHANHSVKPCPLIGPFEPGGPNVNSPI